MLFTSLTGAGDLGVFTVDLSLGTPVSTGVSMKMRWSKILRVRINGSCGRGKLGGYCALMS